MSLNLFNLSTDKNSNAIGVEEGVDYKVMKDGHGIEHRILNFENEKYCPRFGMIELEPMKRAWTSDRNNLRHLNNVTFRVVRDKELDVLIGIPVAIDPKTKNIIWQTIIVGEGEILDLSIPDQAMKWACIKRSPFYTDFRDGKEQNPNFHGGKTAYKAVDRERAAETYLTQRKTKRKAIDIAESLNTKEMEDYALNMGINPKTLSQRTLEVEVIKFAEAEPEKFMAIHNSDTRLELTVLNKAMNMGVVVQGLENGINYGGLTLGFNTLEAVQYLKDHPATLTSIDALARRNEKDGDRSMGSKQEPLAADDANIELARLRKELADKERMLQAANDKAIELQSMKDISTIDEEFADLMKEAKHFDVKGAHNIKDKEKLRAKIAEKKAQTKN